MKDCICRYEGCYYVPVPEYPIHGKEERKQMRKHKKIYKFPMTINKYSKKVEQTWISNGYNLQRCILGMCGETGECAEAFKKYLRGDYEYEEFKKLISKEIGDTFYYLVKLCNCLELNISDILEENFKKLKSRKRRGKIKGNGDNR